MDLTPVKDDFVSSYRDFPPRPSVGPFTRTSGDSGSRRALSEFYSSSGTMLTPVHATSPGSFVTAPNVAISESVARVPFLMSLSVEALLVFISL